MPKSLVTGSTGFIGRFLVAHLIAQGETVVCLVRKTSRVETLERLGATLIVGDVTAPETLPPALEGVDTVYHLAGTVMTLDTDEFFRVNEQGTADLARACAERPDPPVLIFVSSLAVAGPARDGVPRRETEPPAPVSFYGKSKWAAEQRLAEWAGRLPISIVRPPIVYGPGDMQMLKMFRSVKKGLHFVPHRLPYQFSTVHVRDLVDAMQSAARQGRRLAGKDDLDGGQYTGIYFTASDDLPTYADIGREIARTLGRRVFVRRLRTPMVWLIAGICEATARVLRRPLIMNFDKMREATAGSWTCDCERAKTELGFSARFPLAEGLADSTEWYRKEGLL